MFSDISDIVRHVKLSLHSRIADINIATDYATCLPNAFHFRVPKICSRELRGITWEL